VKVGDRKKGRRVFTSVAGKGGGKKMLCGLREKKKEEEGETFIRKDTLTPKRGRKRII